LLALEPTLPAAPLTVPTIEPIVFDGASDPAMGPAAPIAPLAVRVTVVGSEEPLPEVVVAVFAARVCERAAPPAEARLPADSAVCVTAATTCAAGAASRPAGIFAGAGAALPEVGAGADPVSAGEVAAPLAAAITGLAAATAGAVDCVTVFVAVAVVRVTPARTPVADAL
jgi:hypothetical protein